MKVDFDKDVGRIDNIEKYTPTLVYGPVLSMAIAQSIYMGKCNKSVIRRMIKSYKKYRRRAKIRAFFERIKNLPRKLFKK